jgi:hypothetical protein
VNISCFRSCPVDQILMQRLSNQSDKKFKKKNLTISRTHLHQRAYCSPNTINFVYLTREHIILLIIRLSYVEIFLVCQNKKILVNITNQTQKQQYLLNRKKKMFRND